MECVGEGKIRSGGNAGTEYGRDSWNWRALGGSVGNSVQWKLRRIYEGELNEDSLQWSISCSFKVNPCLFQLNAGNGVLAQPPQLALPNHSGLCSLPSTMAKDQNCYLFLWLALISCQAIVPPENTWSYCSCFIIHLPLQQALLMAPT